MDTAAKYVVVCAAGAGLLWYYTSTDKKPQKSAAVQDVKRETKKAARKTQTYAEKAAKAVSSARPAELSEGQENADQAGVKKRKTNAQNAVPSNPTPVVERNDDEAIDQSTRQFAEQMRQARQRSESVV